MSDVYTTGDVQRQNRGGRPSTGNPRLSRVTIRFTDGERAVIDELAGARGIAEYLRSVGLRRKPKIARAVPELNQTAWSALGPCMSNLNQLTRLANEGRLSADLLPILAEIRDGVNKLRSSLVGRNHPLDEDDCP